MCVCVWAHFEKRPQLQPELGAFRLSWFSVLCLSSKNDVYTHLSFRSFLYGLAKTTSPTAKLRWARACVCSVLGLNSKIDV